MRRFHQTMLPGLLALALLATGGLAHAAAGVPDVRILIDVSGSMKRSDPQNLRRSALALMVRLLPAGSRAGVWTFGQYVNMQVRLGEVTPGWRAEAEAGAAAVHSRGLFTNIADALERATWDWTRPEPGSRRHVVLLTDGMVDISADPVENAASRQQVLATLLPRLAAAGVRIHTVALSAQADHALLRALAAETDGAHAVAESAESLQRIFLRMFERAAPVDALPLSGNAFTVDGGVREMTVLVFSAHGAGPTRITAPGGSTIDASNAGEAVTWRAENGYDLVTVQEPTPGEWRIDAAVDPDNRVLVVTDLRLGWEPLANNLGPADDLAIRATLTEKGEPIAREDFLRMLDVRLERWAAGGEPVEHPLRREPGSSRFAADIGAPLAEGAHELVLTVDGGTFARQLRHVAEVVPPALLTIGPAVDPAAPAYTIEVRATPGVIEAASLGVTATLSGAGSSPRPLEATRRADGAVVLTTGLLDEPGEHLLAVTVRGVSPSGRAVDTALRPVTLEGVVVAAPAPAAAPSTPATASPPLELPSPAADDGLVAIDSFDPPNWVLVGTVVGIANIAVILGVWLTLRWMRGDAAPSSAALEADLDEEMEDDAGDEPPDFDQDDEPGPGLGEPPGDDAIDGRTPASALLGADIAPQRLTGEYGNEPRSDDAGGTAPTDRADALLSFDGPLDTELDDGPEFDLDAQADSESDANGAGDVRAA